MATEPSWRTVIGIRGTKSRIWVMPKAFVHIDRWKDFRDSLLHHEGFHAVQNYYDPQNIIGTYKDMVSRRDMGRREMEAYENQIELSESTRGRVDKDQLLLKVRQAIGVNP